MNNHKGDITKRPEKYKIQVFLSLRLTYIIGKRMR